MKQWCALYVFLYSNAMLTMCTIKWWFHTSQFPISYLPPPWRLMMTSSKRNISALLALCAGNSSVTGEFPSQGPVTRCFGVFFDLQNGWVNNRDAGDLRRRRAHYDVIVMFLANFSLASFYNLRLSRLLSCNISSRCICAWIILCEDNISLVNTLLGLESYSPVPSEGLSAWDVYFWVSSVLTHSPTHSLLFTHHVHTHFSHQYHMVSKTHLGHQYKTNIIGNMLIFSFIHNPPNG